MGDSTIVRSAWFKALAVLLLLYGVSLSAAGFAVGRAADSGLQDFRQRWFEIRHFYRGINPYDVMHGGAEALEGVPCIYIGGYPPWSYILGGFVIPPVNAHAALAVFTLVQLGSLAGILFLIGRSTARRFHSLWAAVFFGGLFLALPGVATDLKWGNYTVIVIFALFVCMELCASQRRGVQLAAAVCFAFAFIKPQLAALFGVVLLCRGLWRVWAPAALIVALCTALASAHLGERPDTLVRQVFASSVGYADLYGYAQYYNHGLFDILKLAGVGVSSITVAGAVAGVAAVTALLCRYAGRVPATSLWAIPATFATLWGYNQKYDWMVIFFLLLAFGGWALESKPESAQRNLAHFAVLAVASAALTFKLVWFGYAANCWIQFAVRVLWLAALLSLLRRQGRDTERQKGVATG